MTELLTKGERLAFRIPDELKQRLANLDARLQRSLRDRTALAPSYAHSLSVTARAALETGIAVMEMALDEGLPKPTRRDPRRKQG